MRWGWPDSCRASVPPPHFEKTRKTWAVTFMFLRKSPARCLCCCQHLSTGSHIDNLSVYLFCHFKAWLLARFLAFHQQSKPEYPQKYGNGICITYLRVLCFLPHCTPIVTLHTWLLVAGLLLMCCFSEQRGCSHRLSAAPYLIRVIREIRGLST